MIKDTIISKLNSNSLYFKSRGAERIALFGSYSKDKQNPDSDIDLLVYIEDSFKTYDNFINLAFFLEELLDKRVDLVTRDSISQDFFDCIKDELIYAY